MSDSEWGLVRDQDHKEVEAAVVQRLKVEREKMNKQGLAKSQIGYNDEKALNTDDRELLSEGNIEFNDEAGPIEAKGQDVISLAVAEVDEEAADASSPSSSKHQMNKNKQKMKRELADSHGEHERKFIMNVDKIEELHARDDREMDDKIMADETEEQITDFVAPVESDAEFADSVSLKTRKKTHKSSKEEESSSAVVDSNGDIECAKGLRSPGTADQSGAEEAPEARNAVEEAELNTAQPTIALREKLQAFGSLSIFDLSQDPIQEGHAAEVPGSSYLSSYALKKRKAWADIDDITATGSEEKEKRRKKRAASPIESVQEFDATQSGGSVDEAIETSQTQRALRDDDETRDVAVEEAETGSTDGAHDQVASAMDVDEVEEASSPGQDEDSSAAKAFNEPFVDSSSNAPEKYGAEHSETDGVVEKPEDGTALHASFGKASSFESVGRTLGSSKSPHRRHLRSLSFTLKGDDQGVNGLSESRRKRKSTAQDADDQEPSAPAQRHATPKPLKTPVEKIRNKAEPKMPTPSSSAKSRSKRGTPLQSGPFSAEEKAEIGRAIETIKDLHGLTQDAVNDLIQKNMHVKDELATRKALWNAIHEACPNRMKKSVDQWCRRQYINNLRRGAWTEEEDKQIVKLVRIRGTKWTEIGGLINRHRSDVYHRYRDYLAHHDSKQTGFWHMEEEARLQKIVADILAVIRKSKKGVSADEESLINWDHVSAKMGFTRSRLQLQTKWRAMSHGSHQVKRKKHKRKSGGSSARWTSKKAKVGGHKDKSTRPISDESQDEAQDEAYVSDSAIENEAKARANPRFDHLDDDDDDDDDDKRAHEQDIALVVSRDASIELGQHVTTNAQPSSCNSLFEKQKQKMDEAKAQVLKNKKKSTRSAKKFKYSKSDLPPRNTSRAHDFIAEHVKSPPPPKTEVSTRRNNASVWQLASNQTTLQSTRLPNDNPGPLSAGFVHDDFSDKGHYATKTRQHRSRGDNNSLVGLHGLGRRAKGSVGQGLSPSPSSDTDVDELVDIPASLDELD